MTAADERAAQVERLRADGRLWPVERDSAADLIEADGKRLGEVTRERDEARGLVNRSLKEGAEAVRQKNVALELIAIADDAPHDSGLCLVAFGEPVPCTCWKAEYDSAKEDLS